MKPILSTLPLAVIIFLLGSCGPTPDQVLQQHKREMDSVLMAGHIEAEQQEADTVQVPPSPNPEAVKTELSDLHTRLAKAEKELAQLIASPPGLSKNEQEQAIMDKVFETETLKGQIALLEKMIRPSK